MFDPLNPRNQETLTREERLAKEKREMRKASIIAAIKTILILVISIVIIIIAVKWFSGTGTGSRLIKGLQSNLNGGSERTAILYSYDGTPMQEWHGKIDVDDSEDEAYFTVDGKPVIVHGGIVVIE